MLKLKSIQISKSGSYALLTPFLILNTFENMISKTPSIRGAEGTDSEKESSNPSFSAQVF